MTDRFEAMSVFLAVAEAGSLSGAARRLGEPLPTVSRKVADLERLLATQLLIRTNRGAELTEAGRDYAVAARRILELVEEAEQVAAGEYQAPRGDLTVAAPKHLGELHVLPIASEFLLAHPQISLRLVLTDAPVDLSAERIHAAVRLGELRDRTLIARRVGAARSVTCASPEYLQRCGAPRQPEDLADHQTVSCRAFSAFQWRYLREGGPVTVEPRARLAVESASTAFLSARAGVGIAHCMDYQVRDALRAGELVALLEPFEPAPKPVSLVFAAQGRLPLKVRAFLDWFAPRLKARLAADGMGPTPMKP